MTDVAGDGDVVDYLAMRVEYTPDYLASKLRSSFDGRSSFGSDAGLDVPEVEGSPSIRRGISRLRSEGGGSPARPLPLCASPAAAGWGLRGRPALLSVLPPGEEEAGRGGGFSGCAARELSVAVPSVARSGSRPGSGARPGSHCGSRPSSASSCASSRPGSASHLGCGTPGSRPISQRRLIAEYDAKISTILPKRLLLGAELASRDASKLRAEGVTHILNSAGLVCANHHEGTFRYLTLSLLDSAREDISASFYEALEFIDDAVGDAAADGPPGCVYVHCQHGVSRSATLVVAYLMWKRQLGYEEALDAVRSARPTINPNIGFACALLQWGSTIAAPPTALQAWGLQRVEQRPAAQPRPTVSGLMPPPPAVGGAAEAEVWAMRPVGAVSIEKLLRGGGAATGCYAFVRGGRATYWLGSKAPPQAAAAAQTLRGRLARFHGVAAGSGPLAWETDGLESEAFWQLLNLRPLPRDGPPLAGGKAAGAGAAGADDAPIEIEGPPPPPGSMPPPSTRRPDKRRQRGFGGGGGFGSAMGSAPSTTADFGASVGMPPGYNGCLSPVSPTAGSPSKARRALGRTAGGGGGCGGCGGCGGSSAASAAGEAADGPALLDQQMAVAALQTVSSEILLALSHACGAYEGADAGADGSTAEPMSVVQEEEGSTADATMARASDEMMVASPAAGGHAAASEGAACEEGAFAIDAEALLATYQEALVTRPADIDTCRALAASLSGLLHDLSPMLAALPPLDAVAPSLAAFVASLQSQALRGEALLHAEEAMLAAVKRATESDEPADCDGEQGWP